MSICSYCSSSTQALLTIEKGNSVSDSTDVELRGREESNSTDHSSFSSVPLLNSENVIKALMDETEIQKEDWEIDNSVYDSTDIEVRGREEAKFTDHISFSPVWVSDSENMINALTGESDTHKENQERGNSLDKGLKCESVAENVVVYNQPNKQVRRNKFVEILPRNVASTWWSFLPFSSTPPRYIAINGMRTLADSQLSQSSMIEVVRPCWISFHEPYNGMWHLSENGKHRGQFDAIVMHIMCKILKTILPGGTTMSSTEMATNDYEETILCDVSMEEELRRKERQRQQEAYDDDEDDEEQQNNVLTVVKAILTVLQREEFDSYDIIR
ncbi:FAD/NAD(P)-binding oxidoreductase family protein [Artemisia annua]|uniref:FAD/NAD(P)-binding oxidoreductase family protein n=1 Tax=Artemisia annua TaxID=35608 RepID=A0A2U1LX70_ARTAN|nr:FAD/NAD(P)-binding oxidoreductase family protein [Artemisia annua]